MRVLLRRTKMVGLQACSYEALVPLEDVQEDTVQRLNPLRVSIPTQSGLFVHLHCAVTPAWVLDLPRGPVRYRCLCDQEEAVRRSALPLVQREFPELEGLEELPVLWHFTTELTSREAWTETDPADHALPMKERLK